MINQQSMRNICCSIFLLVSVEKCPLLMKDKVVRICDVQDISLPMSFIRQRARNGASRSASFTIGISRQKCNCALGSTVYSIFYYMYMNARSNVIDNTTPMCFIKNIIIVTLRLVHIKS